MTRRGPGHVPCSVETGTCLHGTCSEQRPYMYDAERLKKSRSTVKILPAGFSGARNQSFRSMTPVLNLNPKLAGTKKAGNARARMIREAMAGSE